MIAPLARSFIRVWYDQLGSHISDSSRVFFDRSPLCPRRHIFSKPFVFPWLSGVSKCPSPCFVNATPLRVAGISGKRCFSRSTLPSPTLIFEADSCAALAGIYYHLPYTNFIQLVSDNLGILFVLNKGSCRNSSANICLQNLAKIYLQSPFLLDLRYIHSENNPADCLTRCFLPFFSTVWQC